MRKKDIIIYLYMQLSCLLKHSSSKIFKIQFQCYKKDLSKIYLFNNTFLTSVYWTKLIVELISTKYTNLI